MARVRIPHLELRQKRLASGKPGKRRWYWVPSRALKAEGWTVLRLPDDRGEAELMAMRQNADVERWRRERAGRTPGEGTIAHLIRRYREHRTFLKLAPATKRSYDQALDAIERWAGDVRVTSVTAPAIEAWIEAQQAAPAQANARLRVLRVLLERAQTFGMAQDNPARRVVAYTVQPRDQVWSYEDEARWTEAALDMGRRSLVVAYALAVYTLQRETDVLGMMWSHDQGHALRLRQSKTRTLVSVPIVSPLRLILDTTPRDSTHIVVSEATRKPYRPDHFRHEVRAVTLAAGLDGLWFRDLRRTGAVRLAQAGLEAKDIAEIGGWSAQWVTSLMDTYLPRGHRLTPAVLERIEEYHRRAK